MIHRAIDATPEALFAAFLDGLREIHARDGMRGVRGVASAAGGVHAALADAGARVAGAGPGLPAGASAPDGIEAIEAALQRAFGRGGLEEAIGELSRIGAAFDGAPARRAPRQRRPRAWPEAEDVRRARCFARDAFERATGRHGR